MAQRYPWATTGCKGRKPNVITSVELRSEIMEQHNLHLQAKYREIEENEVRYEVSGSDKPVLGIVAFGSAARISQKVIEMAHEEGIEVQLLRPITLWPFPKDAVKELASKVKGILTVEINAGQMVTTFATTWKVVFRSNITDVWAALFPVPVRFSTN